MVVDLQGRLLEVNEAYCRMSGYSTDELLAMQLPDLESIEAATDTAAHMQRIMAQGEDRFESRHRRKDGSVFDVEISVQYRTTDGGRFICFLRDITKRRLAEEALRESETRFKTVFNEAPLGIAVIDSLTGHIYSVNPMFAKIAGRTMEELAHIDWMSITHPDDVQADLDNMALLNAGEISGFHMEKRYLHHDGTPVWINMTIAPVSVEGNLHLRHLCMIEDITERKRAEALLLETQTLLQTALDSCQVGIAIADAPSGNLRYVNEAGLIIRGAERQDVVDGVGVNQYVSGWQLLDLDGTPLKTEEVPLARAILFGEPCTREFIVRRSDNNDRSVIANAAPVRDAHGNVVAGIVAFLDRTDQKKAELALRESEERLRRAVLQAPFPLLLHAEDGEILMVSDAWTEITGYSHADIPTIADWTERAYGERKHLVQADIDRLYGLTGKINEGEYEIRTKCGKKRTWDFASAPLGRLPDGRRLAMSMAMDVTERKLADEALRQSDRKFATAFTLNPAMTVLFSPEEEGNRILDVNQAFEGLTGYLREEVIGRTSQELQLWADPRELEVAMKRLLAEGRVHNYEWRIRCKTGDIRTGLLSTDFIELDGKRCAISTTIDITERKAAQEAIRKNEQRLRLVLEANSEGVWDWNIPSKHAVFSPNYTRMLGYEPDEFAKDYDGWRVLVHPDDIGRVDKAHHEHLYGGKEFCVELRMRHKSGDWRWILSRGMVVERDAQGRPIRMIGTHLEITEDKRREAENAELEKQFRQAQKLESVGRLAGGVAHDFNNLLTVINGYSGFLLNRLHAHDPLRPYAEQISQAGEHAASLTKQLLAFSRKQVIDPRIIDLNKTIGDAVPMLQRMIGEDLALKTKLDRSLGQVNADPDQIYQVIMNLAVNARDAMPNGGELDIETANVEVDDAGAAAIHPTAVSGSYVLMTVTDTGHGMDDVTRAQIFEPFFTTKEVGKGTGLGLATVYGIIRQSNGWITVRSEVGVGTSFNIYLPRTEGSAHPETRALSAKAKAGGETVLLVEDQDAVRSYARAVLKEYGYVVIEAAGGEQAIAVAKQHPGEIHLLLTDVVLPGMNGKKVAERLKERHPCLKVVYISGYTQDVISQRGVLDHGASFLQKPFSPDALAVKVREVLDTPSNPLN